MLPCSERVYPGQRCRGAGARCDFCCWDQVCWHICCLHSLVKHYDLFFFIAAHGMAQVTQLKLAQPGIDSIEADLVFYSTLVKFAYLTLVQSQV